MLLFSIIISSNLHSQCGTTISAFPYSEDFEIGTGAWTQDGADDFNWTRDSGGTASVTTGPNTGNTGLWYMYIETSNPRVNPHVRI